MNIKIRSPSEFSTNNGYGTTICKGNRLAKPIIAVPPSGAISTDILKRSNSAPSDAVNLLLLTREESACTTVRQLLIKKIPLNTIRKNIFIIAVSAEYGFYNNAAPCSRYLLYSSEIKTHNSKAYPFQSIHLITCPT